MKGEVRMSGDKMFVAAVVPIGVGGIEDGFEGICSVSIVPVNKAG